MFFELLNQGFPLLHNVGAWKNYAYYYNTRDDKTESSTELLYKVLREHAQNMEIYRANYECLAWSHSIYNPINQQEWGRLVENVLL